MAESDKVAKKMVPPDGGWGWVVVVAYALNNVIMVPILQNFSLVLKDVFKQLDIAATDATIIISVNSAFGMGVGLIHGPLLRNFGYRKIAFIGSMIFFLGITLTAFATTFTHFMVTYGLMASLGVGLTMSSFSLAVNSYFDQKRGRAVGMAMAVTGLGPIAMPQLISRLLSFYGTQGTILVLGGLTLHSLVATMLLQPVKWHATWKIVGAKDDLPEPLDELEESVIKVAKGVEIAVPLESKESARKRTFSSSIDNNQEKSNGIDRRPSTISQDDPEARPTGNGDRVLPYKWWSSGKSLETVNLGSSLVIFDENVNFGPLVIEDDPESETKSLREVDVLGKDVPLLTENKMLEKEVQETPAVAEKVNPEKSRISCWQSVVNCWKKTTQRIVQFFDFGLLRDPIYVNMMLGMSIALFAEINFATLTPFILGDMEFDTDNIAAVMSTLASVDLVSRGVTPFLGEWLHLPARHMALLSLFLLICCRTMLIFTSNFAVVLAVSAGLGFAKGIRSVNMSLVIPNYIPIERLASATGIQMVVNGLVLMILGPFLGYSRDKYGTYGPALIVINSTTAITIVIWITEMFIVSRMTKRRQRKQQYEQVDVRE